MPLQTSVPLAPPGLSMLQKLPEPSALQMKWPVPLHAPSLAVVADQAGAGRRLGLRKVFVDLPVAVVVHAVALLEHEAARDDGGHGVGQLRTAG